MESCNGNVSCPEVGLPIQIIDLIPNQDEPSKLHFKKTELQSILKSAGERPVYLLSIAGASRQGKSFFLTIVLNLLEELEKGNKNGWQTVLKKPTLHGFDFKNGIERRTVGFWMWSRPFILKKGDGSEIAVLLMDTQGVFDQNTPKRDWSMIVGLSILTSSCLIYNIMNNILEDTFEVLNTFLEFGMLSLQKSECSEFPFQKLMFLVRDWGMPDSCPYGLEGGKMFRDSKLTVSTHMPKESRRLRETLSNCFESVQCFLLPHPGNAARSNNYQGNLEKLDREFLINIRRLTEELLDVDNMEPKSINGQPVLASSLCIYFEKYVKAFNGIQLPKPKALHAILIEAKLCSIAESLFQNYSKDLQIKTDNSDFIENEKLNAYFKELHDQFTKSYEEKTKPIPEEKMKQKQLVQVLHEVKALYNKLQAVNAQKRQDLLDRAVQLGTKIYAECLEQEILQQELFPEQLVDVQKKAFQIVCAEMAKLCDERDEPFYPDLLEQLDPSIKELGFKFEEKNKLNFVFEKEKCDKIVNKFTEKYRKKLEVMRIGGGLNQNKLEDIHSFCESDILAKFEKQFKTKNAHLYERTLEQLIANIRLVKQEMDSQIADQNNRLDAIAGQLVSKSVEEFRVTLQSQITQNLSTNDWNAIHTNQKATYISELTTSLVSVYPERLTWFLNKGSKEMDEAVKEIQGLIHKNQLIRQKQTEEVIDNANEGFITSLKEAMEHPDFIFERDFLKVLKVLKPSFADENQYMSWTTDKDCIRNFTEAMNKNIEQVQLDLTQNQEIKIDQENVEFQKECDKIANNYKNELSELIQQQEFKDVRKLDEIHQDKIRNYRKEVNCKQWKNISENKIDCILETLETDLNSVHEHFKSKFVEQLEAIKSQHQAVINEFVKYYQNKIKYKCGDYSEITQEKLVKLHETCKAKAKEKCEKEICRNMDYIEKQECITTLLKNIDECFKTIFEEWQQQYKQMQETAAQLNDSSLSHYQEMAENQLLNIHLDVGDFQYSLQKNVLDILHSYDADIPASLSKDDKSFYRQKLKVGLEEIRMFISQKFIETHTVMKQTFDEETLAYLALFETEWQNILYDNGNYLCLDPSEMQEHQTRIVTSIIKPACSQKPELSESQKQMFVTIVDSALQKRFSELVRNNNKIFSEAQNQFENTLDSCSTNFRKVLDLKEPDGANKLATQWISEFIKANLKLQISPLIEKKYTEQMNMKLIAEFTKWFEETPKGTEVELAITIAKQIYHDHMDISTRDNTFQVPSLLESHHYKALEDVKRRLKIRPTPQLISKLENILNLAFRQYVDKNDMRYITDIAIGIDLGTTHSCVAVYRNDTVEMIPERNAHTFITPSYVLYQGNEVAVGRVAKEQAVIHPEKAVFDAKRLIGRKYDEQITQNDMKVWPFKVVNSNNRPKIQIGQQSYFPEEVSAEILKKLKRDAEKHLNCTVTKAVITVPAKFTDSQKMATKDAGRIAGLEILGILNEPTSAAIAYTLAYTDHLQKNVLVYDLGGGTFDVSILTVKQGDIEVKAVGGNNHLGGEDFDNNMMKYCMDEFYKIHNKDLRDGDSILVSSRLRRIRQCCEKQKICLTEIPIVNIVLECITENIDMNIAITRDKFNELNDKEFRETIQTVERVLAEACLDSNSIKDVVLVGGSSRIPKVQELLKNVFPGKYLNMLINPDEVVARGAAIFAAMTCGSDARKLNSKLKFSDVTPFSLGTDVLGGIFSRIINKNTTVPVTKTQTYITAHNNQRIMDISVFEGEDPIAEKNNLLGKFTIHGIPAAPAGEEQVDVTIKCSKEGILDVSAVIKSTGGSKSVKIVSQRTNLTELELQRLSGCLKFTSLECVNLSNRK